MKILEMLPEAFSEFLVACVIVILSSLYNTTDGASKRIGNLSSAFENADSLSSTCGFEK
jgi:hypothetical protein